MLGEPKWMHCQMTFQIMFIFKSKVKGVQHGCGHDVHMAIALGIAEVLSKYRNSLNGTVFFIFQPAHTVYIIRYPVQYQG